MDSTEVTVLVQNNTVDFCDWLASCLIRIVMKCISRNVVDLLLGLLGRESSPLKADPKGENSREWLAAYDCQLGGGTGRE